MSEAEARRELVDAGHRLLADGLVKLFPVLASHIAR